MLCHPRAPQYASGMPVGCQKPLPSGDLCDISAIGRCRACGEAFCLTHQARVGAGLTHYSQTKVRLEVEARFDAEARFSEGSAYPDWCSACRAAELVTPIVERQQKAEADEAEQRRTRQDRLNKAFAALHAYGFEKLAKPRRETWEVLEKRAFGRQRPQERSRALESAVPIGNLRWRVRGLEYHYRDATRVDKDEYYATGITESDQTVLMEPRDGGGLKTEFDDHAAVGEALWRVLEQHGVREADS